MKNTKQKEESTKHDIETRERKANSWAIERQIAILCALNKGVRKDSKIIVYKTIVENIVTCGAEAWETTE